MSWVYRYRDLTYQCAQASAQIEQPERGIRFPIPRSLTALAAPPAPRGPGAASRCGPCVGASLASGLQQPSQPSHQLASSHVFRLINKSLGVLHHNTLVGRDVCTWYRHSFSSFDFSNASGFPEFIGNNPSVPAAADLRQAVSADQVTVCTGFVG
jgi:hypothetical protein